ncbi:hypothetical protein SPRG_11933 [Saprolegnia parasitica CBS 223.65]|uniref:Uncharacterized protein n=1 Tax=Saprolegnia parasitica (strain CBS 223.65) TaxID=695850 RepID=A0A067BX39_SAPPC|nr:hypothetical protein SPRG_11933 [Saprolegnia parasitica CBS 223.65]KDO23089.1 hypothetical protein SPRG_11933 [Saprolegnia parasitica CBS 223.65]|eukprot:XP_012206201.1 hypothetical protein SPRG_11933 [Saprolegnia parasitica CBS 223.65]
MYALLLQHNQAVQEARHREEARRRAVNSIRLKRLLRRLVRDQRVARAHSLPLFDDGDACDALKSMPR